MTARRKTLAALALLGVAITVPVSGQVFSGSVRAAGLGGNYGAVARGYSAAFWNPANLGLPGNPGFSLYLPGVQVDCGTSPIPLREIKRYGGRVIPSSVKGQWLDDIGAGGSFEGRVGAEVAPLGFSLSRIALTTATQAFVTADLPHDAAEVLLFGNAGRSGTGNNLGFTNGRFRGYAVSSAAVSLGVPLPIAFTHGAGERFAVGVSAKYVVGHGLVDAKDGTGVFSANPIADTIRFPAIALYDKNSAFQSSGVGFDLGLAWTAGKISLGATVYDLVNSFKFDPAQGRATTGEALISEDSTTSSFDDVALTDASPSTRQSARDLGAVARFKPTTRFSLAWAFARALIVSGDLLVHSGSDRALRAGAKTSGGVGIEFRPIHFLPIRGGVERDSDGTTYSVGGGLELGFLNLNGAYG
ncbi:MAG: hypothetical protein ACREMO_05935, partial [Gemmatimonadales bacterium]